MDIRRTCSAIPRLKGPHNGSLVDLLYGRKTAAEPMTGEKDEVEASTVGIRAESTSTAGDGWSNNHDVVLRAVVRCGFKSAT